MVKSVKDKKLGSFWLKQKVDKRIYIGLGFFVIAVVFLVVGINIGNGNISFGGSSLSGLPAQLNYSSVNQVYQALRDNYDGKLTETQVLNGIKEGLAASANDPYTEYFTPAESASFSDELNNSFSGVGAELSQNAQGVVEIIAPLASTPAAKAGLKPDDLITSINGKSTTGITADQAVNLIRGKAGTKVTLGILRGSQQLSVTITRQNITVPSVNTKILNGDIGYMQITSFANDTSNLVYTDAQAFSKEHVKGVVLDLRNDPGGLVTAAVNVSSLWLHNGQTIFSERRGSTVIQTYYSTGDDILHGIPTVVLINGGSASASEITTGALHDNGDAYVIGTQSFGKGVVQQLINLPDGSELKVTVASWYRPDGQDIEHKGIKPDEVVNLPSSSSNTTDTQLNAALTYLAAH